MNNFPSTLRVQNFDSLDNNAVWPHGVQVVITRIPIRKKDGFTIEKMKQLAEKIYNNMAQNGIVFFICYAPMEAKYRPFEIAKIMSDQGFTHIDNIILQKSWYPGKRSETNLVNSYDFALYFCKGNVWRLDRVPLMDYLGTPEELSCPGNMWYIETGSLEESFPCHLAEMLIRMTDSLPGSIILDPFMNTNSTIIASIKTGMSFYGYDKELKNIKKYEKIIDEYKTFGIVTVKE